LARIVAEMPLFDVGAIRGVFISRLFEAKTTFSLQNGILSGARHAPLLVNGALPGHYY